MKRLLSVIVSLSLVIVLFAGVAWAKPLSGEDGNGGGKGNNGGNKASEQTAQDYKNPNEKALEVFKHKLNDLNSNIKEGIEVKNKFKDVNEHWAKSTIVKMSAIGIFNGYEDDTFRPDDSITQVETVALVIRLTKNDKVQNETEVKEDLGDTPEWAKESVQEAVYKGVINLNRFHSHKQASRIETAVLLAKALNLQPADTTNMTFKDGILISQEDAGYITALYQEGIIKGTPDGKFNPDNPITRAEMATIMERIVTQQTGDTGTAQTGETTQSGTTTQNSTN